MDFDYTKVGNQYFQSLQKYVSERASHLEKCGHVIDADARRQISDDYKVCIYELISYLTRLFPKMEGRGRFDLDYKKMIRSLSIETRNFVDFPRIDGTFKPLGDDSLATVSFTDGYVNEAHNMEKIKGLPLRYRTKNLNSIIIDFSIYELRGLLGELRVLPEDNIIDELIAEYEMRLTERDDFLSAVIMKLILNGSEEDLIRAYIINDYLKVGFDFEQFRLEPEQEKRTK